jgi:diguanylate cyclase (GGDEF)-like protein/PAS domain S-box-containing protein
MATPLTTRNKAQKGGSSGQARPIGNSWWSDWGNWLVVGLVIYVVGYIAWLSFGWGSERLYTYVFELGFAPVLILGIVFVIRATRYLADDPQSQKAWMFIGAGLAGLFIAEALWAWYSLGGSAEPFPSPADAFYFGGIVLLLLGVVRFPTGQTTRIQHLRYWLDGAILLISGSVMIGYFIVGPELLDAQALSLESVILFAYPSMTLMVLIAALLMILRRPRPGRIGMLTFFAAGVFIYFVGVLWWAYIESHGEYGFHVPTYALWVTGFALMAFSAQRQVDVIQRQSPLTYPGERAARIEMLLPYLAAVVAFVVFMIASAPLLISYFGILVGFVVIGALLLVSRLLLTLRENTQFQVEQVRQASEARLQALVEYSSDLISVLDADFRFQFQSPSVQDLARVSPKSFIGTPILTWVHPDDHKHVVDALNGMIERDDHEVRFEWRLLGPDGKSVEMETIASNELNTPGVDGIVLNSRDVRERKHYERKLAHRANHDVLTGLLNRGGFMQMLEQELAALRRHRTITVMFIDLDHFKEVNDTLGHDAGDELLIQVSRRMRDALRDQDVVGRFAGDEFMVMMPGISAQRAIPVAERLGERIAQPFDIAGARATVSSSIGVTCTTISGQDPDDLLRDADAAMYQAKNNGRNQSILFQPEFAMSGPE